MATNVDIWMPVDLGHYAKTTRRLTAQEHGVYFLMMQEYWIKGFLDNNDEQLAIIGLITEKEWLKMKPKIISFFVLMEEQWRHPFLDNEIDVARKRRLKASNKGKQGARARWGGKDEF